MTCLHGAVVDVVVDIQGGVHADEFGRWEAVLLDDTDRRGIYLSEGLGHSFRGDPGRQRGVLPLFSAPYAAERDTACTR